MSVQLSPRLTLITVFLRCSAQVSLESGASISFYSLSFILISSVEALHHQTLKDKLLLCAEFHQSKHELIRVSKTNIIQNRLWFCRAPQCKNSHSVVSFGAEETSQ